jgi:hypothetical protein
MMMVVKTVCDHVDDLQPIADFLSEEHDPRPSRGDRAAMAPVLLRWRREDAMLLTVAVILLIAWLLGVVGTYTIGAFVHLILAVAVVLFLVSLIRGRRPVI